MKIQKEMLDDMQNWMKSRKDIPDGWIYLGDQRERYVLGQPGTHNVLVCGVNPSTAVPKKDDPTIRKVRKIASNREYNGWIMVNLYPLIASDPKQLPNDADKKLVSSNLMVWEALIKSYNISAGWAAWGNLIDKRKYLGVSLVRIVDKCNFDFKWYHCGKLTNNGNPRHPLYLKSDSQFSCFSLSDYVVNQPKSVL